MDTRKVTLFATIAVIALVAVGIGYAYTATTVNDNNSASVEFIALKQVAAGNDPSQQGQYNFATSAADKVTWNTKDYKSGINYITEYRLDGSVEKFEEDYIVASIGKTFKVTASPESGKTGIDSDLTCALSTKNFKTPTIEGATISGGNLYFIVIVTNNSNPATTSKFLINADGTPDSIKKWNDTNKQWDVDNTFTIAHNEGTAYFDTTVEVFCALPASHDCITISNTTNEDRLLSGNILGDASITFRASTSANYVTGVSITTEATQISKTTGSLALDATVTGGAQANKAIYWTIVSGAATIVSTDADSALVTLTNAAAVDQTVVIKVTTVDGTFTAEKTLTIVA